MVIRKLHLPWPSLSLLPLTVQALQQSTPSPKLNFSQIPHIERRVQPHKLEKNTSLIHFDHPNIEETKQIHAHLIKTQFDHSFQISLSPLRTLLSPEAQYKFLITSYIKNNFPKNSLKIYASMRSMDTQVDNFTIPSVLKACSQCSVGVVGKEIHGFVLKNGLDSDVFVRNALMQMYSECGSVVSALLVFDQMPERDAVSWSTMIRSYVRHRLFGEALEVIRGMFSEGLKPSEIAVISMVNLFADLADVKMGKAMHGYVVRNSKNEKLGVPIGTALIDMYAKCGSLASAEKLFNGLAQKSVVSWTAMIAGYIRGRKVEEAAKLFNRMQEESIFPNEITLLSLIIECGFVGALELGKWLHSYILRNGLQQRLEVDLVLKTALVDMYAKCGDIDEAYRLFYEMENRDICMWNAMMTGFAMHGCGNEALKLFEEMERLGVEPNNITFVALLHACSHAGLVTEGKRLFEQMVHGFGLVPSIEHYGCMVDLLGRAGKLDEACELIKGMPIQPNTIVWGALLAACKIYKNPNLGEVAAKKLLELEPQNCGYNILMSNIYAASNRWNDVAGVRKALRDVGIKKQPGLTSIEINSSVHDFVMGDEGHPQTGKIYEMLSEMNMKLKDAGYIPNTSVVLKNIDEEEKETALNFHSEKLAMAFGLISTAAGTPIRIVKNLRVCDDCHAATNLLSKIYGRVIIVRDRNRFHHFKEGACSCGDYW
ncbi:hypothetical protein UlMin_030063 [Ulmus minor]